MAAAVRTPAEPAAAAAYIGDDQHQSGQADGTFAPTVARHLAPARPHLVQS